MSTTLYILAGLVGCSLLFFLGWRIASRRHKLPCPSQLGWLLEIDNPFTKIYRAAEVADHLGVQPGMRVLDLGSGPGRITIPIAQRVGPSGEVLAVDIQQKMLDRVLEKARAAGLSNVRTLLAGIGEGKLEHGMYDRAVLVTVLGEIPNRNAALEEAFAALKPGGVLSITEIIFDPHYQSRKKVLQLAGEVGFREKQFFGSVRAYTLNLEKPQST